MATYLRYVMKNLEPLRIADASVSQSGQTDTLRYIPGSTMRGAVIGDAMKRDIFDERLLTDAFSFMNSYLTTEAHTLIPSPKGFYEDKTVVEGKKALPVNIVIAGEDVGSRKRAALGRYCYIEDGCIYYYGVKTGSDLKIKINVDVKKEQSVFRNQYMAPGQYFEGYVKLSDTALDQVIKDFLAQGKTIILGNARSAGLGKCEIVISEEMHEIPYQGNAFDAESECYMMLLSGTAMRGDDGELSGLNLSRLEEMLGVTDLQVAYCATSVKEVMGYNRKWNSKMPSVLTYEAGSMFHLTYQGSVTAETMAHVCHQGLGIRRSEGFGRVMFMRDYETVKYKCSCDYSYTAETETVARELDSDEASTLKIVAVNYLRNLIQDEMKKYVLANPLRKGNLKNSQLGTIESKLALYRYQPEEAARSINEYLDHAISKEEKQRIHKEKASNKSLAAHIRDILESDLYDLLFADSSVVKESGKVMGYDFAALISREEKGRYKIQLIIDMLRFDRKKAV